MSLAAENRVGGKKQILGGTPRDPFSESQVLVAKGAASNGGVQNSRGLIRSVAFREHPSRLWTLSGPKKTPKEKSDDYPTCNATAAQTPDALGANHYRSRTFSGL